MRALGVDGGWINSTGLTSIEKVDEYFYSEKMHELRRGDLIWERVVSIDYTGEKECFDFTMKNSDRPWAVVEDFLVHNCGKKDLNLMAQHKSKFFEGCLANRYTEKLARDWWDIIEPFASYSFNKSHAYAYAFVAYVTAYLKTHYPAEYFSALLTSVKDDLSKAGVFLYEVENLGMKILPPDVNKSAVDFAPEDGNIRFGLSAIRSIGTDMAELIVKCRKPEPFKTYDDFVKALPKQAAKKDILHALAAAGALDSFGPRGGLLDIAEDSAASIRKEKQQAEAGMQSLFDLVNFQEITEIPDHILTEKEIRRLEREYLGVSLTCHPLKGWEGVLKRHQTHLITDLMELPDKSKVTVAGALSVVDPWVTKKGAEMCTVTLQDFTGSIEALIFPKTWEGLSLQLDQVVSISGELSDDGQKLLTREINILTPELKTLIKQDRQTVDLLTLHLDYHEMSDDKIESLREILLMPMYKGNTQVSIELPGQTVLLPDEYRVDIGKSVMLFKIRKLFGRDVFQ
jgi:DNA polymerase-3 subunit alpha